MEARFVGRWWMVGLLLLSGAASAQPKSGRPRLLVLPLAQGSPLPGPSAALATAGENAVLRSNRFDLLPLSEALDPKNARARKAREDQGDDQMRAGQGAYDNLDTGRAVALFDGAVKAYEQTDLSHTFFKLAHAWVMKVASLLANGDARAARLELQHILFLQPNAELSPKYFPPEDLARANQIKDAALAGGAGKLQVQTSPVSARVYVDGRFRGVTPLSMSGLTNVDHYLTVVAPGYLLHQGRFRQGRTEIGLEPASRLPAYQAALGQMQSSSLQTKLDVSGQLARSVGADQVLFALLKRTPLPNKLNLLLVRMDGRGNLKGWKQLAVDTSDPLEGQVASALNDLLSRDDSTPLPRELVTPLVNIAGVRLTYPEVGLLGGGLALIAGGVTLGLLSAHQQQLYSRVHTIGSAAAQPYRIRGSQEAAWSDALNAAGIVSLGVGGTFAVLDNWVSRPEPEDASVPEGKAAPPRPGPSPQPAAQPAAQPPLQIEVAPQQPPPPPPPKGDEDLRNY